MEDFQSKYTGEQVEQLLDRVANGETGGGEGGGSVYKWVWNTEIEGTFTEEEFENLNNADAIYISVNVAGREVLYSVDGKSVSEDTLYLGIHYLSFETDTDNGEVAYVENITFIFDNSSKTWSMQGGNAELITNEQLTGALEDKQDTIEDLEKIRQGAAKGATAIQSTSLGELTDLALVKGFESAQRGTAYALPDEVNGDEDDVLLSRGTVKTINGQTIMRDGDNDDIITAYERITTNSSSVELLPNSVTEWAGPVLSQELVLTFGGQPPQGYAVEYIAKFNVGADDVQLIVPDNVVWADGVYPAMTNGKTYEISFVDNLATFLEF